MPSSSSSKESSPSSSSDNSKPISLLDKIGVYMVEYHIYSIVSALYIIGFFQILYLACHAAYDIRMYAVNEYGLVIHEFDPYFNYRAAEYLWENGASAFFKWYDTKVWYPLGRPVGTTIYPGMQFTSVFIKQYILPNWSINDICCMVPAWFGVLATLATAALCYVTVDSIRIADDDDHQTKSILLDLPVINTITKYVLIPIINAFKKLIRTITKNDGSTTGLIPSLRNPPALESAVFAACIMSIVPAHLMRSVAGGYDNESVATTAMELTFFGWAWCLTSSMSSTTTLVIKGVITGVFYFYMVAAWGGYVFVINLIGIHASFVFLFQKTTFRHLYTVYTSFYVTGTLLAMQVPVVNWAPIKSLEQLGPFAVFAGLQALQLMKYFETKYKKTNKWKVRAAVTAGGIAVAIPVIYGLYHVGYFGPISSRVRGLFVKHTKTGNPLVDSVAEHQAASPQAYFQYLHDVCLIAPVGFVIVALVGCTASSSFLLMYSITTYFISHKMVRLVLLTAPIASICAGIALGYGWAWCMSSIFGNSRPSLNNLLLDEDYDDDVQEGTKLSAEKVPEPNGKDNNSKKNKKKDKKIVAAKATPVAATEEEEPKGKKKKQKEEKGSSAGEPIILRVIRLGIAYWAIKQIIPQLKEFKAISEDMAHAISHPTIITKGRNKQTGEDVIIDDYRQAYFWLRDHTPEDARIMAWWDYGYQITGISNRTTIADGNTWNHEHIGLLGRILTSPEKDAHRIARHLADYVLVWAGGGGDDVAKSPHLRRIANSVYRGLCAEPTCRNFGMTRTGQPSKSLGASLLYKLHSHGLVPGVEADKNRFRQVFRSKYGKVRIFKIQSVSKESKEWVENNRQCDAPGSWYCPGQYPPALQKILKEKKDFQQLEDFNVKDGGDEEYQKQYFENLNKKSTGGKKERKHRPASGSSSFPKLSWDEIELLNEDWENSDHTSLMWELISNGEWDEFVGVLQQAPQLAHVRSEDGRGPMWWAHEYNRPRMVDVLRQVGVSEDRSDVNGVKPKDITKLSR